MAGRLQIALSPDELALLYRIQREAWPERVKLPRFNVAPRQALPVVVVEDGVRRLVAMRWGFPPVWKPRPFDQPPLINAKVEEAGNKPTWRKALRERRALVPTTGFYEWEGAGAARRPLWFRRRDGRPLTLAAVWGAFDWEERKGWPCAAILTCAPNATVAPVHDRMPLIVAPEDEEAWLGDGWEAVTRPAADDVLEAVPVSARLNKVDQDDAALLDPAS